VAAIVSLLGPRHNKIHGAHSSVGRKINEVFFFFTFPLFLFFLLSFFFLVAKNVGGSALGKEGEGRGRYCSFLIADDGSAAASCMQNSVVFGEASMVLQQPCPF
jgi:hypothetical protein